MTYGCKGCKTGSRHLVEPAATGCKPQRLCKLFDLQVAQVHVDHFGTVPTRDKLAKLEELLNGNHVAASIQVGRVPYPSDFDTFSALLLQAHKVLFAGTQFPFAGRFRHADERVYYGPGQRTVEGHAGSEIVPRLRALFASTFDVDARATMARALVAQEAAKFLHGFFCIHPFVDGNGRIARMLLSSAIRSTGRFESKPLELATRQRKQQRAYLSALKFADAVAATGKEKRTFVSPYKHLAAWIDTHLEELEDEEEIINETPLPSPVDPDEENVASS